MHQHLQTILLFLWSKPQPFNLWNTKKMLNAETLLWNEKKLLWITTYTDQNQLIIKYIYMRGNRAGRRLLPRRKLNLFKSIYIVNSKKKKIAPLSPKVNKIITQTPNPWRNFINPHKLIRRQVVSKQRCTQCTRFSPLDPSSIPMINSGCMLKGMVVARMDTWVSCSRYSCFLPHEIPPPANIHSNERY